MGKILNKTGNFISKFFTWTWPMLVLFGISFLIAPFMGVSMQTMSMITFLLIGQNMSFTMVSRSRQSNNFLYHAIASVGSNGFYIFFLSEFIKHYDTSSLKWWYIVCTVTGSVYMHWLAIKKIEKTRFFSKDVGATKGDLTKLREEVFSVLNTRDEYERLEKSGAAA